MLFPVHFKLYILIVSGSGSSEAAGLGEEQPESWGFAQAPLDEKP